MSKNYQYIVKCEFCEKRHERIDISRKHDWDTFHASIRRLIEKGFEYNYCSTTICENRITKQSLIAYDSKTKE